MYIHTPTSKYIHIYNYSHTNFTYIFSIQILMSVAMEHITVLKHVITLKEVSLVDVIVVIYWIVMRLLVMV